MIQRYLLQQGFDAFKPGLDVYKKNPYQKLEDRGMGIQAYQPEATPFFNGWESARRRHEKIAGYALFLDDFRFPNWVNWRNYPDVSWFVVRHFYEFVSVIEECGLPRFISFDFDLDRHNLPMTEEQPYRNGLDCAQWLVEGCEARNMILPRSTVHSTNQEYGPKISALLADYLAKKGWV